LELIGGKDFAQIKDQTSPGDSVYTYNPITSPEKPKYLAFGQQVEKNIKAAVKRREKIVIIDDVYSTGSTIKAVLQGLEDILGDLYDLRLIEIVTVAREGVLKNGEEVSVIDMEPGLLYDVFIPEIIGELNSAINYQSTG
jgi:hypothetical protein